VSRETHDAALAAPRPTSLEPEQLGFRIRRPVRWLGPVLLAATGARVALAEQFGAYLDKRELQSALEPPRLDHSDADEFWFDYVADVGDGFDATYSVAYLLGQSSLTVDGQSLPRGQALVLGGDQVYPTPSGQAYEDRFRGPYRAAMPSTPPGETAPTLYAVPGNHDWYDGLTAFLRVFARKDAHVGAWRTAQTRSYFALQLPKGWWVFAIDAQEGSYLDDPQLEYFRDKIRTDVRDGDKIILCTPTPAWVQADEKSSVYDTTDYFLRRIIGQEDTDKPKSVTVPLMLSGDWHHYARYDGPHRQLITSGNGGAYLFATHRLPKKITVPPKKSIVRSASLSDEYRLRRAYPSKMQSRGLGVGVFTRLPLRNPGFVALLGILHAMLLLGLDNSAEWIPTLPGEIMIAVMAGLTIFFAAGLTAGQRKPRHFIAGAVHGLAQIALGVAGVMIWRQLPFDRLHRPLPDLSAFFIYGPVAALVSAEVVALYLLIVSRFGVNLNELFASQGIQRFKGFLRLHIASDGTLTIYPIGLDSVSKRWRANPTAPDHEPWIKPAKPLEPRLIEPPIVLPARRPAPAPAPRPAPLP
jgi:hypothetical protein